MAADPQTVTSTIYGPLTQTLPVGMRASAAGAALTASGMVVLQSGFGFATSGFAATAIALLDEIQKTLVACGIMKGSS